MELELEAKRDALVSALNAAYKKVSTGNK